MAVIVAPLIPAKKNSNERLPSVRMNISSNQNVPETSDEPLSMPNLTDRIIEEVERLTLEIINETKTLITSGVNYKSVNYIEESDIENPKSVDGIREIFNQMVQAIQDSLNLGNENSENYDYLEYLKLFNVRYNNGEPEITISLNLIEFNKDDVEVVNVKIDRSN